MLLVISMMVRFVCFATPFWWGVYGVGVCFSITWSAKNGSISWKRIPHHCPTETFWFCTPIACLQVPWTLWIYLNNSIWVSTHTTTHFLKSYQWRYKIPCTAHGYSPHGATHITIYDFQKLGRSSFPLVWKRNLILFFFNARFTKQRGCGVRNLPRFIPLIMCFEGMYTLHVQIIKAVVPKLEHVICRWNLHQVGHFHFVYLNKINFI